MSADGHSDSAACAHVDPSIIPVGVSNGCGGGAGVALKNSTGTLTFPGLKLAVEERLLDSRPLGPRAVLIQMKAVGICGSDVHYLQHGRIGDFIVKCPMVLGHECAGVVVGAGSEVKNVRVGDRVAIEPGEGCGVCEHCTEGRYNLCAEMSFMATPPVDGALASFVVHPAGRCFKMPDSMSFEEGALLEPLSVALQCTKRADLKLGQSVLILGAGPIGLAVALTARAAGARSVTLVDVSADRLALARSMLTPRAGEPECIFLTSAGADGEPALLKALGSVDVTFECSGAESATAFALRATKSGGTVALIGLGCTLINKLPLGAEVIVRELNLVGSFRYAHTYPTAIRLVETGAIPIKQLVTHRIPLRSEQDQAASDAAAQAVAQGKQPQELGPLNQANLLKGFETARVGSGENKPCIKVMFSL